MVATPMRVDFRRTDLVEVQPSGVLRDTLVETDRRPRTADGKLLTRKQIRARGRRAAARGREISSHEFNTLYKDIDEWDMEELAMGRPRHPQHGFRGAKPRWITAEIHEKAMERFKATVKGQMSSMNSSALEVIHMILESDAEDRRGRPHIPASVKLEAAKFLLEHTVGKPKQHIQSDISVRLQGLLGTVMVNPNQALAPPSQGGMLQLPGPDIDEPPYQLAHLPGQTIPIGVSEDIQDAELVDDEDADLDDME